MKIAILGNGFIGTKLYSSLSQEHEVTLITKENYNEHIGSKYDVFINANGNSKRFLANQLPKWDFVANCQSTFNTLYDFKYSKYIYLSTLDVFKDSVYAYNKYIAETILMKYQEALGFDLVILRMSMLVGKEKAIGLIADIQKGVTLGVSKDSQFQIFNFKGLLSFINKMFVCTKQLVVVNLTGYPAMSMQQIEKVVGKEGIYKDDAPTHIYDFSIDLAKEYDTIKTSEEYLIESLSE